MKGDRHIHKHTLCFILVEDYYSYQQSTHPTGNLVPSMHHVLLMHTFTLTVYWQATALLAQKKKHMGYVHEAKTYLLFIIQNTLQHWRMWGQDYCTVNGGDL